MSKYDNELEAIKKKWSNLSGDLESKKKTLEGLIDRASTLISEMEKFKKHMLEEDFIGLVERAEETKGKIETAMNLLNRAGLNSNKLKPIRDKLSQIIEDSINIATKEKNKYRINWSNIASYTNENKDQVRRLEERYREIVKEAENIVNLLYRLVYMEKQTKSMISVARSNYIKNMGREALSTVENAISAVKKYVEEKGVPQNIPRELAAKETDAKNKFSKFKSMWSIEIGIVNLQEKSRKLIEEGEEVAKKLENYGKNTKAEKLREVLRDIEEKAKELEPLLKWEKPSETTIRYHQVKEEINKLSKEIEKYKLDIEAIEKTASIEAKTKTTLEIAKTTKAPIQEEIKAIKKALREAKEIRDKIEKTTNLEEKKEPNEKTK